MSTQNVIHEPDNKRFIIPLEGDSPAELTYAFGTARGEKAGQTLVDFTRTFVPPAHRNRGLAEKLVRHGLAWAKGRDCQIETSCSYVARFITHR